MRAPTVVTICMKFHLSAKKRTRQKWLHEALPIVIASWSICLTALLVFSETLHEVKVNKLEKSDTTEILKKILV